MKQRERLPHWPRMMRHSTAAAYCDLSLPGFNRMVASGVLPMAILFDGREYWDRYAIDSALDLLSGVQDDWRQRQPGLVDRPDWRRTSGLYNP